jgi:type IV pilus assembly protein PilB
MTLTPSRPVPTATLASQQRLEVELLLGEPVLSPGELQQAGAERWNWSPALSRARCQELGCLPVRQEQQELVVAVPTHWAPEQRQQLLDLAAAPGGRPVALRLALQPDIQTALNASPAPQPAPAAALTPKPRASLLQEIDLSEARETATEAAPADLDLENSEGANASPIVSLVDKVLVQALSTGASDIHIEPQEDGLVVRFRQDGVLEQLEKLPRSIAPAVASRLKVMADLDIAERRLPQDGRIRRRYRGKTFDLRVSTLPTRYGEKVCMRLLDSGATQLGLDKLITDPLALASIRDMGSKPFGMILVTGPTGSGKSTTLYSLLAERNDPGINISTVEDPIEYSLKGIAQTQVNREKGYDFAMALRAFMRQDPDVLLVGETRDLETAKTAIEAALTGHLVLTTLHCNDAPTAIARLAEMGVEAFMVSASLIGIVSQRLLRRVCPSCRVP